MAHNHVELFAFQSCRSDPAAPLDQTDRAAAARLVRSCLAKPYKLHKGEPWPRDLPVKPRREHLPTRSPLSKSLLN